MASAIPTALVVSPTYALAGTSRARELAAAFHTSGIHTEVIAAAPAGEEYMELDAAGTLVHRLIAPISRLRLARKMFELKWLWNRRITWVDWNGEASPSAPRVPHVSVRDLEAPAAAHRLQQQPLPGLALAPAHAAKTDAHRPLASGQEIQQLRGRAPALVVVQEPIAGGVHG